MSTDLYPRAPPSRTGEPAWAIAGFFPMQGSWRESDYHALETDHFVELVNGHIDVLALPTWLHQVIVLKLHRLLADWVECHSQGTVLVAPIPLKLFDGTIREPDVLYIRPQHAPDTPQGYPKSADLVMEVVSSGNETSHRDHTENRNDCAKAGIPEYWIVDPQARRIIVLTLDAGAVEYSVHGDFSGDEAATSRMLGGFQVVPSEIWALADRSSG